MEPFRRKVRNRVCDRRGIRWVSERKQTRSDTRPLHFQGSNVRPPPPPPQKSIALKEKTHRFLIGTSVSGSSNPGGRLTFFSEICLSPVLVNCPSRVCVIDSWVLVACSCYLPQLSPTQKDWDMPTKIVKCQNQFTHVLYIYIYTHPAFATLDASPELTIVTTSQ